MKYSGGLIRANCGDQFQHVSRSIWSDSENSLSVPFVEVLKCLNCMTGGVVNVEGADPMFECSFMNFKFTIS